MLEILTNLTKLTNKVSPIGLDIGHHSIKMIQLADTAGHLQVIAAEKVDFDQAINGDSEKRRSFAAAAVSEMLGRGSFRGRNVVSCLSNEQLKIKSFRLDAGQVGGPEAALESEIAERLGLDLDTESMNYMVAGDVIAGDETKTELILFTACEDTLKKHIEFLEESNLIPVAIDTIPCALFRSFEKSLRREKDSQIVSVFVDVGSRFTTVVITRGRDITFVKQIPIGTGQFDACVSNKLSVSLTEAEVLREKLKQPRRHSDIDSQTRQMVVDAIQEVVEKLAAEISLCFRYYSVTFRGSRPGRAFFAGGGTYEQRLLDSLRQRLGVEIEIAEPLKGFDFGNAGFGGDRRGPLCEWAVAVGLCLKGWNAIDSGVN